MKIFQTVIVTGFIFLLSCSNVNQTEYKIIEYDFTEESAGQKGHVDVNAIVNSQNIDEAELLQLLEHLLDSVMNNDDPTHKMKPQSCKIFVYPTIKHLNSKMGQWIGSISKSRNKKSPLIITQLREQEKGKIQKDDALKDIAVTKQKEIWKALINAEDKSSAEAEKKFPIKITETTISKIKAQKELVKKLSDKHYEHEQALLSKYKNEIINEFEISNTVLEKIASKGLDENWPFPQAN